MVLWFQKPIHHKAPLLTDRLLHHTHNNPPAFFHSSINHFFTHFPLLHQMARYDIRYPIALIHLLSLHILWIHPCISSSTKLKPKMVNIVLLGFNQYALLFKLSFNPYSLRKTRKILTTEYCCVRHFVE